MDIFGGLAVLFFILALACPEEGQPETRDEFIARMMAPESPPEPPVERYDWKKGKAINCQIEAEYNERITAQWLQRLNAEKPDKKTTREMFGRFGQ